MIELIKGHSKGEWIYKDGENVAGKMTFSIASDTKIIIDHTEVNTEYKGQGIGKALLDVAVKYCRENGIKIIPLCPFVKANFEKNQTIHDVLS